MTTTTSYRRLRASRANGARSRGPRTSEGKARSSQNAIRHGLLAKCLVLSGESEEGFEALLSQHQARLAPADDVDRGFIDEMAAAAWRLRRAWALETRLLDGAVQDQPPGDDLGRMAAAFSKLAAGPELALLHRYETRLHMNYQRALRNLLLLRQACMPNKPSPTIEHHEPQSRPLAPSPARPLARSAASPVSVCPQPSMPNEPSPIIEHQPEPTAPDPAQQSQEPQSRTIAPSPARPLARSAASRRMIAPSPALPRPRAFQSPEGEFPAQSPTK